MKKILVRTHTYKSIAQTWSKVKPRLAFTLAEVLVVIGIIGMIADLTLPNLIQNYQKQVYVTKLKKAYTIINQALTQLCLDRSCEDLECTGLFNEYSVATFGDEFVKKFKVLKNCGSEPTLSTTCISPMVYWHYDGSGPKKELLFGSGALNDTNIYNFITIDGMSIAFRVYSTDPIYAHLGLGQNISLIIDVNGLKPPNTAGRDLFKFAIISRPILYANGAKSSKPNADDYNNPGWWNNPVLGKTCVSSNTYGFTCAGRIMEEGWQMNY